MRTIGLFRSSMQVMALTFFVAFLFSWSDCSGKRDSLMTPSESTQQDSSKSFGAFGGTWDWIHETKGNPDSEFTLVIHQKEGRIDGSITAAAQGGNRVSYGEFSGVVTGPSAKIDWWLGRRHKPSAPADGKAILTLAESSLSWRLQYDGDQEIWFPDTAILKPKSGPAK